jgi:hypothetical protein
MVDGVDRPCAARWDDDKCLQKLNYKTESKRLGIINWARVFSVYYTSAINVSHFHVLE